MAAARRGWPYAAPDVLGQAIIRLNLQRTETIPL